MARPRSKNPKNKHIGIVTTDEKFRRYKALNLVGDKAIDVLLYHLENENKKLQIDKIMTVEKIKEIDKQIKNLEFEKLQLETTLDELNHEIGFIGSDVNIDVDKAVNVILQRFNNQKVYSILEFLENNQELIKNQAYLCGLDAAKLEDLVFDKS